MNPVPSWFVTGTDTEIGKTLISSALLHTLAARGLRAAGMKPVAAGAVLQTEPGGVKERWQNEDAEQLAAAANVVLPPELATPYLLRHACAPHIAATLENITIDCAHIQACFRQVAAQADAVVVEGVGGFCVPLSTQEDTAELARRLDLPVILVVGLRLGCLSHALLTAEAIRSRGLRLAGWVANSVDPCLPYAEDNVEALIARLDAPLLGVVPRLSVPSAAAVADFLDCASLPGWPASPH